MTESIDLQKLAYFGAREKIKSLLKEKREIDSDINDLKKFLRSGKKQFVNKVAKKFKKRKISAAARKIFAQNAAKARAAKAAKNGD